MCVFDHGIVYQSVPQTDRERTHRQQQERLEAAKLSTAGDVCESEHGLGTEGASVGPAGVFMSHGDPGTGYWRGKEQAQKGKTQKEKRPHHHL